MRVCLIAEKPSLALQVLPVIWEMHPDLDPDAFAYAMVCPYTHLNTRFRYPRGLRWQDYPFAGEPDYQPFGFGYPSRDGEGTQSIRLCPRLKAGQETYVVRGETRTYDVQRWRNHPPSSFDAKPEAERRFRAADIVYGVIDPFESSWLALDHALMHLSLGSGVEVRTPDIRSLWGTALTDCFRDAGRAGDEAYASKVRMARISRRFDFGYQVNALAVLRRTLDAAGIPPHIEVPSKFAIQTLYLSRERGPLTEGYLVDAMEKWKGTGRYPHTPYGGLGNTASRGPIIHYLQEAKLLEQEGRTWRVSALGHDLIRLLHPDCEDPDLRFRIEAWKELPEDEANARIDRYLRTFFGKQIRYLAKSGLLRS